MFLILETIDGPCVGARRVLRDGQRLTVGRTEWADFCLSADEALSDVHFEVEFGRQGCRVRDLNTDAGTRVNGTKMTRPVQLNTGDRITAGASTFTATVEGELPTGRPRPEEPSTQAAVTVAGQTRPAPRAAAEYCRELDLSDEARQLVRDDLPPANYLDLLAAHGLFADAFLVLAFYLPKPKAVTWGCACVRDAYGDQLSPGEKNAVERAQQWVAEPSEENRRAAGAAAEDTDYEGAAAWVAMGAFWSGGSVAPPGIPETPPPPDMTAQAITTALLLASARANVSNADDLNRGFLARGRKLTVPEEAAGA